MSESSAPELELKPGQTTQIGPEPSSGITVARTSYLPGEVIDDRYRLVRELGRGGMGVVWLARSLVLDVDVALKLIRTAETGAEAASRMAREANAAARVAHPALVRVFDFGWTQHGDPFLVMELIRGEPLSEIIKGGSLGAVSAVQTLLPIADGLRLAHSRSIVHRDIKPGNIIIAEEGTNRQQPKLLDFGIAKVGHGGDGKLTQEGAVLGSPEYMSPEQALGLEHVDARSDVWSFGVALYELVTGEVPFSRPNYNALMQAIIHDEPEPIGARGGADAALWSLIAKALQKHPEDRWPGMNEFGAALALWLFHHGVKEDVSGNSVRAVWLDEELDSAPPRPSTLPKSLRDELASLGRPPIALKTGAAEASLELDPDFVGWRPSKRRRNVYLAAGAGILALVAALALGTSSEPPQEEPSVTEATILPHPEVEARPSVDPIVAATTREVAGPPESSLTESKTKVASPKLHKRKQAVGVTSQKKSKRDFGF